jgi:hypothetical protein
MIFIVTNIPCPPPITPKTSLVTQMYPRASAPKIEAVGSSRRTSLFSASSGFVWSAGGDKSKRIRVCEEEWGFLKRIEFFVRRSGFLQRGGEVGGSGEVELSEES